MCRSSTWTAAASRRGDIVITRASETIFLITAPEVVDAAASVTLCEAVAAIAHIRPSVVLDFTSLRHVEETAARLVLRLAALLRAADGHLLVLSSAGAEPSFHEVATDDDGLRIAGEFGRAVRRLRMGDPS